MGCVIKKVKAVAKVIDEVHHLNKKQGGGLIKIEIWVDENYGTARYSMTYINHAIYAGDNGRVLGYDNAHGKHHRHYFGDYQLVRNFKGHEKLLEKFSQEWRRIADEHYGKN